jgi:hypothetical protein
MIHLVGISTVVCGSFWGIEKIQNGGRCHGNQGTKWLQNKKILRFGRNLVSKYIMMLRIDIHCWFAMVLGIG